MDAPTKTLSKDVLNQTATHTLVPPTDEELADYSLVDADKLVMLAFSNLQTAARIYKRDGLTQPQMVERLSLLGIKTSVRTIKRVFADLRAAQDPNFKPVGSSKRAVAYKKAAAKLQKGQFGLIAPEPDEPTPLSPIEVIQDVSLSSFENERSYARKSVIEGLFDLQPDLDSDVERSLEPNLQVVSYDPKQDTCNQELGQLREAITLIHQIIDRNSNGRIPKDERFADHQWRELDQELQLLADLCHTRWQKLREHMDGIREDIKKAASVKIRQAGMSGNEEG